VATDKKLVVLVSVTAVAVSGLVLDSVLGFPSVARQLISSLGVFSIILVAAVIGIGRARYFTFSSAMGTSLMFLSIGIFCSSIGDLVWGYYNVIEGVGVPYPSLADVFYLGMIPLASYGLFLLLKSLKFTIDAETKMKLVLLPATVSILTYFLFVQSELGGSVPALEKALNVAYPIGDALFLSFSLMILSVVRGSTLAKPIRVISIGFILVALADFAFSWTTSLETYSTGNWIDVLYMLSYFTIGAGMYFMGGERLIGASEP